MKDKAPSPKIIECKFSRAWDDAIELDTLEEKLKTEQDVKKRQKITQKKRGLANRITPTAKQAAATRNRALTAAILRYIREQGAPSNIANLLVWLRGQGFQIADDNAPRDNNDVTARTVRSILGEKFGVGGRAGRKPKVL